MECRKTLYKYTGEYYGDDLMVVKPIINLATKYTDDIVGLGVRKWTKPTTFEGLSYAEEIIGDTFIRTTKKLFRTNKTIY